MYDLSSQVRDCANALSAAPALVLRIDFAAGSLYFSDTLLPLPFPAAGSISRVEKLSLRMDASGVLGEDEVALRLADPDGSLLARLEAGDFGGVGVVLLQCYAGLPAELAVELFRGLLIQAPCWLETSRELSLRPAGAMQRLADRQVLTAAARRDFPELEAEDEGEYLPLCMGQPRRVPGVCVFRAVQAKLAGMVDADTMDFYVDDASEFPQGTELRLRIGDELLAGTFRGNHCTISRRADFRVDSRFAEATGSPVLMRLSGLDALTQEQQRELPGQWLILTVDGRDQFRQILSMPEAGIVRIRMPFLRNNRYYQPGEGMACVLASRAVPHTPGAVVAPSDAGQTFVVSDGGASELLLVEGETEDGFVRVPDTAFTWTAADTAAYPGVGRPLALLRLPVPLTRLPDSEFTDDRVYVTLLAGEQNPARILQRLLTERLGVPAEEIDEESFAAAADARAGMVMSFALASAFTAKKLLRELCVQARLALVSTGGRFRLRTLQNSLSGVGDGEDSLHLTSGALLADSLRLGELAAGDEIAVVRGAYRGGEVCVVRAGAGGGVETEIPLWAFDCAVQARQAAEWWLQRLARSWREVRFTTFLPGLALERLDTVVLDGLTSAVGGAPEEGAAPWSGRVLQLARVPRGASDEVDGYEVVLECPQWSGCAASCESVCETGACESSSCEASCTVACELACENTCQSQQQTYGQHGIPVCTKTCQIHCRTAAERACGTGCEIGCESACEVGCQLSCEGESYEASCPTGCETATESGVAGDVMRRVRILSAPESPGGAATVLSLSGGGETFPALDSCDLHPQAGDEASAVLSANGDWVLASAGREAKFVRVLADLGGGSYTVVETTPGGTDWGESFTAILPS